MASLKKSPVQKKVTSLEKYRLIIKNINKIAKIKLEIQKSHSRSYRKEYLISPFDAQFSS